MGFWMCAIGGLLLLLLGLLVPAHMRALDVGIIERAGRNSPSLTSRGMELANAKDLGAAQLLLEQARRSSVPDYQKLSATVAILAGQHPDWQVWGGDTEIKDLFAGGAGQPDSHPQPFTEFVVRLDNRARALDRLQFSVRPTTQELIRCRALTNTAILPPSRSTSGQAFDTALCIFGLLLDTGRLSPGLSNNIVALASRANRGGGSQPFEEALMDMMSLAQRLNWDQLAVFVSRIEDAETLHQLSGHLRRGESQLPAIFSAVQLSGNPVGVAHYLSSFSQSGVSDLGTSLRFGAGGVKELLARDQRLYDSATRGRVANDPLLGAIYRFWVEYCWRMARFGLILKWILYAGSGFLLALALHYALPAVRVLERPLQVRGFHFARETLFALGFLLVVLLVSEPFLAQESQKADFRFQLRLPTVGSVVAAGALNKNGSIMNQSVLLTMLLFFVLQSLLYVASLLKLAEIRRQRVEPRMKLKLLENEDHLFDAGLYLGFLGTIVSFILVSVGVFKQPSLMAAYSSTSFGILFVVTFKVLHLRPARRTLLLEAEPVQPEAAAKPTTRSHTYATAP